uniref:DNA mismatch repair protein MSH3 n=1 Tax=Zeugodacus cucurbitae TaxID=28588 RepID=A0A0A1XGM2_ZEUCU
MPTAELSLRGICNEIPSTAFPFPLDMFGEYTETPEDSELTEDDALLGSEDYDMEEYEETESELDNELNARNECDAVGNNTVISTAEAATNTTPMLHMKNSSTLSVRQFDSVNDNETIGNIPVAILRGLTTRGSSADNNQDMVIVFLTQ